jgi:hypothetical protein
MDPHELEERQRLAEEGAEKVKRDLPRIRIEEPSSDRDSTKPAESAPEHGEDGQAGV